MRRKGFSYLDTMDRGVFLPVIEAGARYHASARYDDVLRIHAEIRDARGVRLALEVVRGTEAAALASARLMGRGDNIAADQAAVTAMRKALGYVQFKGCVVIGEGERDEAPMLYIGEEVGSAGR